MLSHGCALLRVCSLMSMKRKPKVCGCTVLQAVRSVMQHPEPSSREEEIGRLGRWWKAQRVSIPELSEAALLHCPSPADFLKSQSSPLQSPDMQRPYTLSELWIAWWGTRPHHKHPENLSATSQRHPVRPLFIDWAEGHQSAAPEGLRQPEGPSQDCRHQKQRSTGETEGRYPLTAEAARMPQCKLLGRWWPLTA